jgi:hypothetical protein
MHLVVVRQGIGRSDGAGVEEGKGRGIGYGPRLLVLSFLHHCTVRTILLDGFYLCSINQHSWLEASKLHDSFKLRSREMRCRWDVLPVLDQNE